MSQADAHAAAWTRALRLWQRFDIVKPEIDRLRRRPAVISRRTLVVGAIATAVGAGYLAGRHGLFADVTTGIGERRTLMLADGSTVELGSYSAMSIEFTDAARQVLLHRGEGFFDVAADGRPFMVASGGGTTRALGTRFDVKYVDDLVTVVAIEHAVTVESGDRPAVVIEQGWQLSYDRAGPGDPTRADLEAAAAWRNDRIMVQDVPLHLVLAELDRYRRGRIVLLSRQIADIPVTAVFDTRRPDDALQTIADTLPIRLLQAPGLVTVVYPDW
ncbi:fec operon regulator FecR [Blastochloris viridis]|uniref:FecR protein n=1 Tax=Blastochloris viridis TaxID=1079 RepID=A0A182CXX9_BLAVI|nr:fec operon regulator FecR [Blastochloris viridis]BAR98029.1 FecR protein [Blastochloris viridis]